jgi:hypothetical protein
LELGVINSKRKKRTVLVARMEKKKKKKKNECRHLVGKSDEKR